MSSEIQFTDAELKELMLEDFDDFDDIQTSSITANQQVECRYELSELLRMVCCKDDDVQVQLTDQGKELVESWLGKDKMFLIKSYAKIQCDALKLFESRLNQFQANRILLKIIEILTAMPSEIPGEQYGKITEREVGCIEYLGGYCLKKALKKFSSNSEVIQSMCGSKPQGDLITLMEFKVGSLVIPSEEAMQMLQKVFYEVSAECHKPLNLIDFESNTKSILKSTSVAVFVDIILNMNDAYVTINIDNIVWTIVRYIVHLFCKVLAFTFTKKLFFKLFKKHNMQSSGLRGDLKKNKQ